MSKEDLKKKIEEILIKYENENIYSKLTPFGRMERTNELLSLFEQETLKTVSTTDELERCMKEGYEVIEKEVDDNFKPTSDTVEKENK